MITAGTGLLVASYLVGAVPFGLILGLLRGVDPRRVGSGNIGATNMMRAGGRSTGVLTFLLDAGKGAAGPLAAQALGQGAATMAGCGLAAVVGHCFPVYLGFRGGKGVATLVGAFLALDPGAVVAGAAAFVVSLAVLRTVAISSMALALTLAAMTAWRHGLDDPRALVALAAALLVAWTHRSNWRRLLAGGEGRAFERSERSEGGRHG